MPDLRALLDLPDAKVNARLARCMGWTTKLDDSTDGDNLIWYPPNMECAARERQFDPPEYTSEDSPRRLLGEVEAHIQTFGSLAIFYEQTIKQLNHSVVFAPARIRARAALVVLEP